jgi:transcriptional regulator with XRE-family HTH domain
MSSPDRLAARRFELMAAEFVQRMGARIAQRRNELGLSQVDVARALPGKVDGSQVSRWERGLHKPGDDTLERLGVILEVPVSYFMTPEPDQASTPDLFAGTDGTADERLDRIEAALTTMLGHVENLAARAQEQRGELMDRLEALETAILHNGDVVADRAVDRVRDMVKQPDEVVRAIESLAAEFHADADQLAAQRASERGRRAAPRRPARAAK